MNSKESFEKTMQAQMDQWHAEMEKLKAKAAGAQADARVEYQKQIDHLQKLQQDGLAKMAEFRAASDDAWRDLRVGMESAWEAMGNAMKAASSRFK
ncbi:MAG: hypothetical protein R3E68_05205 [Burkholderiaceae bacterium]